MSLVLNLGNTASGSPISVSKMDNPHVFVTGRSGSGKSYFLKRLLAQASSQGALCLVLDYTGDYRETGKGSMKKLTQGEINTVARVLQNLKDGVQRGTKRTDEGGDARTVQQRRKIYALTEVLGWNKDPSRIQGFVKRMTGVDRLEWLNVGQCEKVIEGLKAMIARQQGKEASR